MNQLILLLNSNSINYCIVGILFAYSFGAFD